MTILGEMMKLYFAVEGYEHKDVAEDIGISQSTLSRFLSGKNTPDTESFIKILNWMMKK